jgi:sugar lactone lactonase YvrE
VAVNSCGVSISASHLLIGAGDTVRTVNTTTDQLTTPAGLAAGVTNTESPDGTPGKAATIYGMCGIAQDLTGNLVMADEFRSRIVVEPAKTGTFYGQAMTAGDLYTIAGGSGGTSRADGIAATSAQLEGPWGITLDPAGNIVIADTGTQRIRVIAETTGTAYGQAMAAGSIYTLAGGGCCAPNRGDGGPAIDAELFQPMGVAFDQAGDLLIADTYDNRIRVVAASSGQLYGMAMVSGDIYTIAGDGAGTGSDGRFTGDGVPATLSALYDPQSVAVDRSGNLVIADTNNNRIRVVASHSGTYDGQAMVAGNIYTVAGDGTATSAGDGGPAGIAQVDQLRGLTVDGAGNIVFADMYRVRLIASKAEMSYGIAVSGGDIYTVAGNGTRSDSGGGKPALQGQLDFEVGLSRDANGNILFAEADHVIRVFAGSTATFYGQAMTRGYLYRIAGNGTAGYSGDAGPALAAELRNLDQINLDRNGNIIIADTSRVRVIAAKTGTFYGQAMTALNIYTVAGSGSAGFSGDGGSALAAAVQPWDAAPDAAGNIVISDGQNNRVRVLAATTGTFYGIPMTAGDIYTIAGTGIGGYSGDGGVATGADLYNPAGLNIDKHHNVIVADGFNGVIRVIAEANGTFYGHPMLAGHIYSVAGNPTATSIGDGGPATAAMLNLPSFVTLDHTGNLIISDQVNNRIRVVPQTNGTFYGQAMVAGTIYTIAGTGSGSGMDGAFGGDGGPASNAQLFYPNQVAFDGAGNLLVADSANNRIRRISA